MICTVFLPDHLKAPNCPCTYMLGICPPISILCCRFEVPFLKFYWRKMCSQVVMWATVLPECWQISICKTETIQGDSWHVTQFLPHKTVIPAISSSHMDGFCPFSPYLNLESKMVDAFQSQLWDSSSAEETDHLGRPEAGLWHTWWAMLPKWTLPCTSLLFFLNPSLVLATFCTCLFLHTGPGRWTEPILPRPDLNYFLKSFWSLHPPINVLFHSHFPMLVHRQLTATTSIVRAPAY